VTIYGDYDADGVCATAILVDLLRGLGGDCDWLIPDRITEGYGLNPDLIETLAARGTDLIVTVDCGINSVAEAELARSLGMEIVITDHHQFGDELPDCPLLHPVLNEYPYPHLCGAGVAAKLASVIREVAGLDPAGDEADLDLVALATVADMMPLDGENRTLVREGTAVARRGGRLGMRALMSASGVEPVALSSKDFGFRLGPRINAVGRMYRADAGVELFLTDDPIRAGEIGKELSRANAERKAVERQVEAEAEREFQGTHGDDASVIVVAGEGWHAGVVGIVAARLSREHGLPAVVISMADGIGKGSARSVPGLDLHDAISEVADLLVTFGGHKAAAGLTVPEDRIDQLRVELDRAVAARTGGGPVTITPTVDAFVGGSDVDIEAAEQLSRLEPFGNGNRAPCLVIPSARVEDVREMGEGKHCRFSIVSGGHRAAGLAFGRNSFPGSKDAPLDLLGELSINHWKGTSGPRFQVTGVAPRPDDDSGPLESADDAEWRERFEAALAGDPLVFPRAFEGRPKDVVVWPGSAEAAMAQIVSSGSRALVLTAEAFRRWITLGGGAIGRFIPHPVEAGVDAVCGLWSGSPIESLSPGKGSGDHQVVLLDFETLALSPGLAEPFEEVVVFDSPSSEEDLARAGASGARVHRVEDRASLAFSLAAVAERSDPVPRLRVLYRQILEAGALVGSGLLDALQGSSDVARSPERAATLVTVMLEAGIVTSEGIGPDRGLEVVSSKEVDLDSSAEFRKLARIQEEQISFIRQSENQRS
jgi:single-stranded-DNA-specific exonuclease